MTTPNAPVPPGSPAKVLLLAVMACGLVGLPGCDRMKQFIDPSGTGYRKDDAPAATNTSKNTQAAPAAKSPPAQPSPLPSPPRASNEVIVREKARGRFLTDSDIEAQLPDIDFTIGRRTFRLVHGIHRDRSGITTVRDSAGRFWGRSIGDLNMDGSDDAVVLLRTDMAEGTVVWDLAYLPNHHGRIHNVQTLRLPGDLGFGDVVIEGSEVILTPISGGPNVHLGYSGGELVLSPN